MIKSKYNPFSTSSISLKRDKKPFALFTQCSNQRDKYELPRRIPQIDPALQWSFEFFPTVIQC